jgi:hypothetical protein
MNSCEEWRSWQVDIVSGELCLLAVCPAEPTVTVNFTLLWFQSARQTGNIQIHLLPKVDRTVQWRHTEHQKCVCV